MAGHARYTALLDACVLYPMAIADALMSIATTGLFAAKWTRRIEMEWIGALEAKRPDLKGRLEYRRDQMRDAISDWEVEEAAWQPLARGLAQTSPMRAVVQLQVRLIQYRELGAGDGVGYNHEWTAPGIGARVATVSVGYADGFLRSLTNRATLRFQGQEVPLVGRVSMDTITVDVSSVAPDRLVPGALFDLLDEAHDINALAAEAGTNAYEILTSLGPRYRRIYAGLSEPCEE